MKLCSKVSNNDAAEESNYTSLRCNDPRRLNQIEIWFGILTRKVVRRGIFTRDKLVTRLMIFFEAYNQQTQAFEWTYKGKPLAA
jgi:hypothetical protein